MEARWTRNWALAWLAATSCTLPLDGLRQGSGPVDSDTDGVGDTRDTQRTDSPSDSDAGVGDSETGDSGADETDDSTTIDSGDSGSGDSGDSGDSGPIGDSGDSGNGDSGAGDSGNGDSGVGDTGDSGDSGSGDSGTLGICGAPIDPVQLSCGLVNGIEPGSAIPLTVSVSDSQLLDGYSCDVNPQTGHERVLPFTCSDGAWVTVSVTGSSQCDVDAFAVNGGCDAGDACLAWNTEGVQSGVPQYLDRWRCEPGQTYAVVLELWAETSPIFGFCPTVVPTGGGTPVKGAPIDLRITCSEICDDGVDNDDDDLTDCDDAGDCFNHPSCPGALEVGDHVDSVRLGRLYYVPPAASGEFTMGCLAGRDDVAGGCDASESPSHLVQITRAFWAMEREVSQGMWTGAGFGNPSVFSSCGADCPVEKVNWWEALMLANAASTAEGLSPCYTLSGCTGTAVGAGRTCTGVTVNGAGGHPAACEGYRLPTEAEWEWMARGGDATATGFAYAGSDDVGTVAWYDGNSGSTTHAGCGKARNGYELCDLSGNVFEWTWDWYDAGYYDVSPLKDPTGPATGDARVSKGGGWRIPEARIRTSFRIWDMNPTARDDAAGFRLVRSIE